MTASREVLSFWFGASGCDGTFDRVKYKMWFGDGRQWDDTIRTRFGVLHEQAARGALDTAWTRTPRDRLALIVVLDQFSRHIHRGTPRAFAQDPSARRLALDLVGSDQDRALDPVERAFCYLPFAHAEDRALQERSVACFERLAAAVAPQWRESYEGFLDSARRHRDIVARFGRFPHRNATLGRTPTPEEAEFLKTPGSAFG